MVLKVNKSFLWLSLPILGTIVVMAMRAVSPGARAGSILSVQPISNPAAPGSIAPNLTDAPGGRVILSWLEPAGSGFTLKFAVRDGNSWGPTHNVIARQNFERYAEAPPWVTMLADSGLVAIWGKELPNGRKWPGSYLYAAISHDGGREWSQPHVIHSDRSKSEHSFASVAPLSEHAVLVIWLDARDYATENRYRLMSAEIDSSGIERNEQTVDDDVCTCCPTSLARVGSQLFAAYRDHTSDNIRDIGIARQHKGIWSRLEVIHADGWRINACPVNGPALASDGASLTAVWYTAANGRPTIKFAWSRDMGKSFQPPAEIDTSSDTGKPIGRAAITSLPDRGVLLTWLHQRDDSAELLATISDTSDHWEKPSIVSRGNARSLGYPRAQVLGTGTILSWGGAGDEKIVRTALVSPR